MWTASMRGWTEIHAQDRGGCGRPFFMSPCPVTSGLGESPITPQGTIAMTTKPPKPFEMGAAVSPTEKTLETAEREQAATLQSMAQEIYDMPNFTFLGSPMQQLLNDMQHAAERHPALVTTKIQRLVDAMGGKDADA